MHTVEIAERIDAALKRGRHIGVMAEDLHQRPRLIAPRMAEARSKAARSAIPAKGASMLLADFSKRLLLNTAMTALCAGGTGNKRAHSIACASEITRCEARFIRLSPDEAGERRDGPYAGLLAEARHEIGLRLFRIGSALCRRDAAGHEERVD